MPRSRISVLSVGGLVALLVTGCATTRQPSADERARNQLTHSQDLLRQAQQEEKDAVDQQKKVEAAHQRTVDARQQLAKAQQEEQAARAKVAELQQRAEQHMQQARQDAQQAQLAPSTTPSSTDTAIPVGPRPEAQGTGSGSQGR